MKKIKPLNALVIIAAILYFVVISFYVIYAWFIPSDELNTVGLTLSWFAALYWAYITIKSPRKGIKTRYGMVRKPLLVILILFIAPFFINLIVFVGSAAAITRLLPPNKTLFTTIHEVSIQRSRKSCDNRIELDGLEDMLIIKTDLCVGRNLAYRFKAGEDVKVVINQSFLGVRVYKIEKYQN